MSTREELEAAVARAEADWARASTGVEQAQAERAKANAVWDQLLVDRRKARTDRRKATTAWDQAIPDRRKAGSDRRIPSAEIADFSKMVAHQHEAYLRKAKADTRHAAAQARFDAAALARANAIEALRAERDGRRVAVPAAGLQIGRAVVTSLRKALLG